MNTLQDHPSFRERLDHLHRIAAARRTCRWLVCVLSLGFLLWLGLIAVTLWRMKGL